MVTAALLDRHLLLVMATPIVKPVPSHLRTLLPLEREHLSTKRKLLLILLTLRLQPLAIRLVLGL